MKVSLLRRAIPEVSTRGPQASAAPVVMLSSHYGNMGLNLPEILIFGTVLIVAGARWSNWGIAHSHGTAHITGWLVMLAGFFIFLINIIPILARFVPRGSS